jgi:hypothetical protein
MSECYSPDDLERDVGEVSLPGGAVHTLVGTGGINSHPDWAPSGPISVRGGRLRGRTRDRGSGRVRRRIFAAPDRHWLPLGGALVAGRDADQ